MDRLDAAGMALTMALALMVVVHPATADPPLPSPTIPSTRVVSVLQVPGTQWMRVPQTPPGRAASSENATLRDVQRALEAGDARRALTTAQRVAEKGSWGRDRDAALLVVGLLHRENEHHNLASEAFTKVRLGEGPLAPFAAYYEAEQDLARGKPQVAVQECTKYREDWPKGVHANACMALMAKGYAETGLSSKALEVAAEYDKEHEHAPIRESIELLTAEWEVRHAPQAAIRRLKKLAVEHNSPLTGRLATQWLDELVALGHEAATLPDDTASLKKRAVSLRDSGERVSAWATFETLMARAGDDPSLARWVEAEADSFGWKTRNYAFLADLYAAKNAEKPNPEDAWDEYRALSQAAKWKEATDKALVAQKAHGASWKWRQSYEDVGRSMLLAGRYADARDQFDVVKKQGGWSARRAEFFGGFASLMNGDRPDAEKRFSALIDKDRGMVVEARYWRARTREQLGNASGAAEDRDWIRENAGATWYGLLVRQADPNRPTVKPFLRDGTWPGLPPASVRPATETRKPTVLPLAGWVAPARYSGVSALAFLRLPLAPATAPAERPADSVVRADPLVPPPSYRESALFEREEAREDFFRFAEKNGAAWPELAAIYDLSRAGLYDLSGPLLSTMFEDWREAQRLRSHPKHADARAIRLSTEEWRDLFLFARDHHHAARFTVGLSDTMEDEASKLEALRLQYPLAHDRYVWTHAHEHGLDPYLVLGLMRQESTYNAVAVSRADARGAMQIMPKTGHLLSDRLGDVSYTAGDLEDPIFAVGYGITYLGLLMERFGGNYPLALASYNGGPHKVSSWLAGTGMDMPLDAFVEHIPFRETQNYVKVVSEGYGTYLTAYAPTETAIVLAEHPSKDDASVVDF